MWPRSGCQVQSSLIATGSACSFIATHCHSLPLIATHCHWSCVLRPASCVFEYRFRTILHNQTPLIPSSITGTQPAGPRTSDLGPSGNDLS